MGAHFALWISRVWTGKVISPILLARDIGTRTNTNLLLILLYRTFYPKAIHKAFYAGGQVSVLG